MRGHVDRHRACVCLTSCSHVDCQRSSITIYDGFTLYLAVTHSSTATELLLCDSDLAPAIQHNAENTLPCPSPHLANQRLPRCLGQPLQALRVRCVLVQGHQLVAHLLQLLQGIALGIPHVRCLCRYSAYGVDRVVLEHARGCSQPASVQAFS